MERLDNANEERFVKALIYGPPGTGKTTIGVTAPNPLILLSERQGMTHVRLAAQRLGIPTPKTVLITKAEDYRNVLRALRARRTEELDDFVIRAANGTELIRFEDWWPTTVVMDSFTDAQKRLEEEIDAQAPPTLGSDGLPKRADRFWNALMDRTDKLVRSFRDLPYHVLFLALLSDKTEGEGDNAERVVQPLCSYARAATLLAAAVNVVGVTYRKSKRTSTDEVAHEWGIITAGPGYMLTKPCPPLRSVEVPDFGSWVKRLGEAGGAAAPVVEAQVEAVPVVEDPAAHAPEPDPEPKPTLPKKTRRQRAAEVTS